MHALAVCVCVGASTTSVYNSLALEWNYFAVFFSPALSRATYCQSSKLVWYGGRPSMCRMHTKPIKVKCIWPRNWITFDGYACARRRIFWQQLSTDERPNDYYIFIKCFHCVSTKCSHSMCAKNNGPKKRPTKNQLHQFLVRMLSLPLCLCAAVISSQLRKFDDVHSEHTHAKP